MPSILLSIDHFGIDTDYINSGKNDGQFSMPVTLPSCYYLGRFCLETGERFDWTKRFVCHEEIVEVIKSNASQKDIKLLIAPTRFARSVLFDHRNKILIGGS